MRLMSRRLWTLLVALIVCSIILFVMLSASDGSSMAEELLQDEQVVHLPTTDAKVQKSVPRSVPEAEPSTHAKPIQQLAINVATPAPMPAELRQENENAMSTRQQQGPSRQPMSIRERCWKPGFSPASGKQINHTPGDFLISQSDLCSGRPLLLAQVHSEYSHRERRDLIRSTWASINNIDGHRIVVVFIVGATETAKQQTALQEESEETADIVQVPCGPDGQPRTSTCKALYGLKWATRHCQGAEFVLKVDDYAFVNLFQLVTLVTERLVGANKTFYCKTAANENRIAESSYYWYVSEAEWPDAKYPLHCKGLAYLMSGDLPSQLLRCAAWRNFLRLEDVFVTGVLGNALGAHFMYWLSGWDSAWLHPKHAGPAVATAIVLTSPEGVPLPGLHRRVWKAALRHGAGFVGLE